MRKRRTRQHIIADLSANYVERQALLCGFAVERVQRDYGYDLGVQTFSDSGEVENGLIMFQLKATDHIRLNPAKKTVAFVVDRSDLELWLKETDPVILVVYDGIADVAYHLYLQRYFEQEQISLSEVRKTITVHIPESHILNKDSMMQLARFKNALQRQYEGVSHS